MRDRHCLPMVLARVLVSTGCATQREWGVWRSHSTHFATDDHLAFSATNAVAGAPRVTPELMDKAKGQGWWGRNIPSDVQPADVAGNWSGTWTGHGLLRSDRYGVAQVSITQKGATGEGILVLQDWHADRGDGLGQGDVGERDPAESALRGHLQGGWGPADRDLPLHALAGPDRGDAGPLSPTRPPQGGVGWTTMVRITAR